MTKDKVYHRILTIILWLWWILPLLIEGLDEVIVEYHLYQTVTMYGGDEPNFILEALVPIIGSILMVIFPWGAAHIIISTVIPRFSNEPLDVDF